MSTIVWPYPNRDLVTNIVEQVIDAPPGYSWYNLSVAGGELWLSGHKGVGSVISPAAARKTSLATAWEVFDISGAPGTRVYDTLRLGSTVVFSFNSFRYMTMPAAGGAATLHTALPDTGTTKYFVENGTLIAANAWNVAKSGDAVSWSNATYETDQGRIEHLAWDGAKYVVARHGWVGDSIANAASPDLVSWEAGPNMTYVVRDTGSGEVVGWSGMLPMYTATSGSWSEGSNRLFSSTYGSPHNGKAIAILEGGGIFSVSLRQETAVSRFVGLILATLELTNKAPKWGGGKFFDGHYVTLVSNDSALNGENAMMYMDDEAVVAISADLSLPPGNQKLDAAWGDAIVGVPLNSYLPAAIYVPPAGVNRRITLAVDTDGEPWAWADLYVSPVLDYDRIAADHYVDYTEVGMPSVVFDVPASEGGVYVVVAGDGGTATVLLENSPFWTGFINCEVS